MKSNLVIATRVFPGWAALATLLLPAPLYGAQPGFPFSEDFQSQSLLSSTQTTARWTSSGVTLGQARGRHMADFDLNLRNFRIGNSTATTGIKDIAARDMDGNGRLDVLVASDGGIFVYYIDEDDDLESIQPVRITPAGSIRTMVFGDFDRDGDLDVVVAGDVNAVILYRNGGSRSAFENHIRVSSLRTIALASADMDGDGDLDLVLAQRKGKIVQVHLNDGKGNFSLQGNAFPTTSGQNRALGVGDFDEDGDMDLGLAKAGGVNVFHLNDGNGVFDEGRVLNHPGNKVDYRDIAVGDVNNDGHLDIVVGVHKAQNILYLNDGNGGFGTGSRINNSGARTAGVELVDMDGDGDLDLVEGVSRRGHRIYVNQNGALDSVGAFIDGKTNAIVAGDVYMDHNLELIHGKTLATLKVSRLTKRRVGDLSTSWFDTGHGRVVSSRVNGGARVPRVVYLTATAVRQEHTDIEYYLSNNDGKRWIRAYPGKVARFSSAGNVLRWRAELKSRSPIQTTTLTRVGIENVLQVFIDGDVFRDNEIYTATSQTTRKASTPVTVRLLNRGDRALTITGIETIREAFVLQDREGEPLPQPLSMEIESKSHVDFRLVFEPERRGTTDSVLTIFGREGRRVLPEVKVELRGRGLAPEIRVLPRENRVNVRVGTSDSQVVKIRNEGEELLRVSTPTITNPEFSLVNAADFPVPVTAGESVDIRFWFEPENRGTTTTDITFFSNSVNGAVTKTLTGKGTAPVISVQRPGTDESVPSVSEIDFGSVRVNRPTSLTRVIKNTGDLPLIITAVTVENARFALLEPVIEDASSRTVPVNGTLDLTVQFNPQQRAPAEDTLIIHSDAFNVTQSRITLRGRGTGPEIAFVGDNKINFGDVRAGQTGTGSVVIKNTGDEPLIVSGVKSTMSGDVPEDAFSLVSRTFQTVPAGATATLIFGFMPTTRMNMPSDAALVIDGDAINLSEGRVTVRGRGIAPDMVIVITGTSVSKLEGSPGPTVSRDFGNVPVNGSTSRRVFISNELGTAPLRAGIPAIDEDEPFEWEMRPASDMVVVAAGDSTSSLILAFRPKEHGPSSTTLTFSGDALNGPQTVTLTGRGVGMPKMAVFLQTDERERRLDGQTHHLGNVTVGRPVSTLIYLGNSGTASLDVSGLDAAGEGFSVDSELAALPEPGFVRAGVSATYVGALRFDPVGQGAHTGTLTIRSDDANGAEFTVPLRANAVSSELDIRIDGEQINPGDGFSGGYDFGEVLVGESVAKKVIINKTTTPLVTIRFIYLADDGGGQFDVVSSPLPAWGDNSDARVEGVHMATSSLSFTPMQTGSATAVLVLREGGERILSMLTFRAAGVAPRMSVGTDRRMAGADADGHDFGMVSADAGESTTVTVSNNGNGDLKISSIRVAGAGYRLDGGDSGVIAAGSSANWTVHFTPPGNAASYRGVLTIASNDRESGPQGVWTLELKGGAQDAINHAGTGTEPRMAVAIDGVPCGENCRHDFGETALASTTDIVQVVVSNTGTVELDISSIGLTGRDYSLANADVPQTVAPGGLTTFSLRFAPTLAEPLTGVLSIVSDPRRLGWSALVTGHGKGPRLALKFEGRYISENELLIRDYPVGRGDVSYKWQIENSGNEDLIVESYGNGGWQHGISVRKNDSREGLDLSQIIPPKDRTEDKFFAGAHVGGNWRWPMKGFFSIGSNDPVHPVFRFQMETRSKARRLEVYVGDRMVEPGTEYDFGDVPVGGDSPVRQVRVYNAGGLEVNFTGAAMGGSSGFNHAGLPVFPVALPDAASSTFNLSFAPMATGTATARLTLSTNDFQNPYIIALRGNGVPAASAPSAWAGGAQKPAIPAFAESEPGGAPRFVGLGYADNQSRLWLAFDEPAQILSGADARVLADGAALSGFEVLPNYAGDSVVEDIGVLRARYRSGGVVMDLARGIVPADVSVWVRYTPPSDGVSGIYDLADPPNRISSVRLFMLPRSAVLDYDGDGFPDALEARLGGNPLVADDVVGLPEVALLRAGVAGSPAAVAYSGIRADGVAAHLGVVTTGASSLAAYYLSDTFGYSSGYAPNVGGYGCTGRFPADYASPLFGGGCAVVDFNNIRAGVEHRIGWLATNAAGYWAVAEGTASRLPEQVILRVPEFNMKRRNVFVANSAAADETVVVGAFHDGPASLSPLTVSFGNVAAAASPSSSEPDGFSVSVAGGAANATPNTTPDGALGATPEATPDGAMGTTPDAKTNAAPNITNYAITGVHSGEAGKLWLAGDPLSSLTPDKYSLGKVTKTGVVRLADDNLPPLFGRASLYAGTTADANERHAVVVRGTENYIALLPVVQGSAQTASAFEVLPWDGAGGGPMAADDRILAVNKASPVADGALVRIAFTASSPPATVRNTVSLEVAASSAGASTATTVLTWPVIDSADALASIAGDNDNDGIPDVRDSYRLLNRLPVSVAGGVSGYPDRSTAGANGWHHIRPLLPLHNQFVGSYATRAGLSYHTSFKGDARILARLPVATSGGETIVAPEGQSVLAATYQPGVAIQMNYADFAASLSRDEFDAIARQSRRDISVVYNFRLHGVEPSVAQDASPAQGASLAGGRAGVVIPLPESLREHANILPLHYTNGAWSGFSTGSGAPATAGFAPLQAGACPDDSGGVGSAYRAADGALNTRKRTGDACLVLYLTDGAAADRDGNINGVVDALIGLAVITLPR